MQQNLYIASKHALNSVNQSFQEQLHLDSMVLSPYMVWVLEFYVEQRME